MIVKRESVTPIDFDGLEILDYTASEELSSSLAVIRVPPGGRHALAWSRRSDKYYLIISGDLQFSIDGNEVSLRGGDACIIPKGSRFLYRNESDSTAEMVLVHTPNFKLEAEVLEE